MLDAENKRIAENLASKVSRLKSVCQSHILQSKKNIQHKQIILCLHNTCMSMYSHEQLAYDIDKEAEEQNSYLDGMVRVML